jgi:hypothetical protein
MLRLQNLEVEDAELRKHVTPAVNAPCKSYRWHVLIVGARHHAGAGER